MKIATGDVVVIAHRGASGYRPEHTLPAYELAVGMCADYIEPDLVMTRDGVLVDRHEPDISETTDVAERPEFVSRRRTRRVDGTPVTGWFVDDFTLEEVKSLRAVERLPDVRPGSSEYDGRFEVPTLEEVFQQRAELSRITGRTVGVIPEIKHPTYLRERGFDPEAEVVRLAEKFDLNRADAPLWVQCLEPTALQRLKHEYGLAARTTFLTEASGGPWDLHRQGTTYAELTTPEALDRLSRWGDGLSPAKAQVIPRRPDGTLGDPTPLVDDAHAAGLWVTPWTFRSENRYLPADCRIGTDPAVHGNATQEVIAHLETGVDGVFCDQPEVGVQAREKFLAGP